MFQVILGGGRGMFMPNTTADPEYPDLTGHRGDGQNLIDVSHGKVTLVAIVAIVTTELLLLLKCKGKVRSFSPSVCVLFVLSCWSSRRLYAVKLAQ